MRLVLLDRDGVINQEREDFVKSVEEWEPIPGSMEAIGRLCRAGFRIFVVTNQSGLGRGLFSLPALHAMHEKMRCLAEEAGGSIDGILFCPHHPKDDCHCRKPEPGLFETLAGRLGLSLGGVPAIGDSRRDLLAARSVGARPLLVRTGKGEKTLNELEDLDGVTVYSNLAAAADALIAERD